jgi:hypothetical protein
MALPKHPFIYKAIDDAINAFGERHNITARQHLAPLLGFRGDNSSIMLGSALNYSTYNAAAPKPISIDHLAVLLRELGEDKRIILDAIAKECGGVFTTDAETAANHDNVRDELIQISGLAGALSNKFLEYKHNDGVIDDLEASELEKIAFETRKQLKTFEELIQKVKGIKE